jgi:hypothetical protein
MKRLFFHNKIYKATICVLLIMTAINFSIVTSGLVGYATTESYEFGYDHECDDARIANPSDRYINQPDSGPSLHTDEFMDGYDDGFYECSFNSNNIGGDGNVTLAAECQMSLLNDDQLFQQLSEHQCLYFNSCMNPGDRLQVFHL